jgi:hypothetical protein
MPVIPLTTCIGCNQTDDHPKLHRIFSPDAPAVIWHHDCFTIAHPDDGADHGITEIHEVVKAAKGKTGDELRAYLTGPDHAKHVERLTTARDKWALATTTKEN